MCVCVYIYSVATIFGLFYKIKEFCFDKILNLNLPHIYPTFIEKDNHKRLKDNELNSLHLGKGEIHLIIQCLYVSVTLNYIVHPNT